MPTVAAASVFCAPGIALHKDPGQASLSKQHKGDNYIIYFMGIFLLLLFLTIYELGHQIKRFVFGNMLVVI